MSLDLERYSNLPPHGRDLIRGWHYEAQQKAAQTGNLFAAFMYEWVAFNAWASCVTDLNVDREIIDCLGKSSELSDSFDANREKESSFRTASDLFLALWPIFDARQVREFGPPPESETRSETIQRYLRTGANKHAPKKWILSHKEPSWNDSLDALYQVRCNLFHGGKWTDNQQDQEIVLRAYEVLHPIFDIHI